jgi:hypothetical protein
VDVSVKRERKDVFGEEPDDSWGVWRMAWLVLPKCSDERRMC